MSKVYLSGPITGTTYQEARYGWRKDFSKMLAFGIIPLSPMRHEGHLAELQEKHIGPDTLPTNLFSHPNMIVSKDFLDIEQSDLVLVNLLEAKIPSQGTLIELGYAKALGKTIVTVMAWDDAIHTSPFIPVVSSIVVTTLSEAAAIVNSLLSEGI